MDRGGRGGIRAAFMIVLLCLAAAQIQTVVLVLDGEARGRDRAVRDVRAHWSAARPRIEEALRSSGASAALASARRLLPPALAFELLDAEGRPLASEGSLASGPVARPPQGAQSLDIGRVLAVGPTGGPSPRLVVYGRVSARDPVVFLRMSRDGRELAASLDEDRRLLVASGVGLILAMVAAILAMLMGRPALATQREGRDAALDAYETAVERLRARDHAVTQAHQEELRHLRETIKDKEAMARAGELTSGIVHEVRNGLGTLAGYVRLLEQTPGASAETGEIVRSIREECQALESVIRRIVEFVRTEKLRPSGIDLRRFLERVVARERHSRAGAELRVEVPEDLCVVGDEDLLERAFENLVRNARDAAGGQGHVAVEARAEEDGVCVRIEDDGPGLPPQLQGGLRPFGTTKPGGLGLGLPTALKIITLHGGGLDLLPRKPRGLTAQVRLPYSGPAGDATSGDTAGQAPDRREGGAD